MIRAKTHIHIKTPTSVPGVLIFLTKVEKAIDFFHLLVYNKNIQIKIKKGESHG